MKFKRIIWKSLKVFFILCVIAGVCIVLNFKGQKQVEKNEQEADSSNIQEVAQIQQETLNEIQNEVEEQTTDNSLISEETNINNIKNKEEIKTGKQQTISTTPTSTVKEEQIQQNNKIEEPTTIKENTKQETQIIETPKQEIIPEKVEEKPIVQETKKEYVKNTIMINKIKSYLQSHESEMMKKYGYTIVEDSSIVNQVGGFTYSDFNLSATTQTAGTIKVYARDYVVDGKVIETQCFVL